MTAADWIRRLKLLPHPEGGYYRETYRAGKRNPSDPRSHGPAKRRSLSTAIYFLLLRGQVSRLHRIRSDELWHHYDGGSLTIHCLDDQGLYQTLKLGKRIHLGEQPQALVPAGTWFGATLAPRSNYALVGCTVAPGFDFTDLELGNHAALRRKFPGHHAIIKRLLF